MKRIASFLLLFCFVVSLSAQKVIKVACVGNSITEGFGLKNPKSDSYPVVLGRLLGSNYEVRNFGVSGSTLILRGGYPYMKRPAYSEALAYEPDIVTIKLGTNDSKPENWQYKEDFIKDMKTMVKAFKKLKSHPTIYLCYPATAYEMRWNINNGIIENEIIPIINKVAGKYRLTVIDTHHATAGMKDYFPDGIHPNEEGSKVIAQTIYKVLVSVPCHK